MNVFSISITAVDKTTATVKRIENNLSKLARPTTEVSRSFTRLGNALHLDKLGEGVKKFAMKWGGLTAAVGVSAGALYELESRWGALGWEVSRTALTLGLSTSGLQSMRGAATLAGVSASDLTSGMKSLGDTLEDALYGRNQQALMMLNRLGIGIRKTKDGAVDSKQALYDLADAIHGIKSPQVQGLVARQFGLEALLPELRLGSKAMKELEDKARRVGAVMSDEDVRASEALGKSLSGLKLQLQGVQNQIGHDLLPVMSPLIDKFDQWLGTHKKLAAALGVALPTGALVASLAVVGAALTSLALSPGGLFILSLAGAAAAVGALAVGLNELGKKAAEQPTVQAKPERFGETEGGAATMNLRPMGRHKAKPAPAERAPLNFGDKVSAFFSRYPRENDKDAFRQRAQELQVGRAPAPVAAPTLTEKPALGLRTAPDARLLKSATDAAVKAAIPPSIFTSLISTESNWDQKAVSNKGAIGLTQLMPGTAKGLGVNPNDTSENLTGGATYLAQQFKKYGNWRDALAAYNIGPNAKSLTPSYGYADKILADAQMAGPGSSAAVSPSAAPVTAQRSSLLMSHLDASITNLARNFNNLTLSGLIDKYSETNGERDQKAVGDYKADVSKRTGFGEQEIINTRDPQVLGALVSAMIRHEQGQNALPQEMIDQAVNRAVNRTIQVEVAFANAPAGTRATVRSQDDGLIGRVRIGQSMPATP